MLDRSTRLRWKTEPNPAQRNRNRHTFAAPSPLTRRRVVATHCPCAVLAAPFEPPLIPLDGGAGGGGGGGGNL